MSYSVYPYSNQFDPVASVIKTPQNINEYFTYYSKDNLELLRLHAKNTDFHALDKKTIELIANKSSYEELNLLLEEGLPPNLFYSHCEGDGPFTCSFTSITLIELSIKAAANPSFDENSDEIKKVKLLLEKQGSRHLLGYKECNGNSCLQFIINSYIKNLFR